MIADGFDTFVEVGPGNTLTKFIKKISKDVRCYSIETTEDLAKAMAELDQKEMSA
jgi:[acyl-carrier-protein] S-malonyltransferase